MKTILLILFTLPFLLFAQQPRMSVKSQVDVAFVKKNTPLILKENSTMWRELPLIKINGQIYVSFVGKLKSESYANNLDGVIVGDGIGAIRSVRIRIDKLDQIEQLNQLSHLEIAGKIKPDLAKVNYDTRADSVHAGLGLPQAFTGKNVIIGIQDWGFDYTQPMFYDTLLQNTRILAAWDQFKRSGPHPALYNYGAEYSTISELLTAETDTSNQLNHSTHGTHVSGIAGGSGAGVYAKGMSFENNFLFTTILVDEAAAIDAWNWMYLKAQSYGKRLVVNMSWGLYHFSGNDGTSLLSQAIESFTDNGVLFVSSAGNNGDVNFHIQKEFNNDSIRTKVKFYDYALHDSLWGQSLHGWGEVGKNFEMKIQLYSSATNLIAETPFYSSMMNGYDEGFIVVSPGDTVWYNVAGESAFPSNGKPTIRFRVNNKFAYSTVLVARATDGVVHFWNLVELTTNGGNWGQPFQTFGTGTIAGDTQYGIGEPTCATDCISIASHSAQFLHSSGNVFGGARSSFSSIGPRNDGAMKPDISAPGSSVVSSINSFTTDSYTAVETTNFQGKNYYFASMSGTSMASPVVAGICALIWEANPYLSPRQVKNIIIQTARLDQHTGQIPAEGDVKWGHGKIDALAAVKLALTVVGVDELSMENQNDWQVYPNPANSFIKVNGLTAIQQAQLIDINGKQIDLDTHLNEWNISNQTPGIYLFRVVANNKVYQKKLIIN
ncbi:MAG: S8 family peptidase [Crocinitomicaceae bacterium]|nr:S8 family peptidase [Crocinitomicaceae bacterium]